MMIHLNGLLFVVGLWVSVTVIDVWFKKSKRFETSYSEWLNLNGVSISLAHIRLQTTRFNRYFRKIGHCSPKFLLIWFYLGAVFGVVTMIVSVVILSAMLVKSFYKPDEQQILQPVMPGMNMPWDQVVYYMLTLVIAGAFHEIGHAVAAARENVRIISFGVFILFLYPGAFVELHTDQLEIIQPVKRLRIFTAGIWHNFVLAVFAVCCSYALPYSLLPFYQVNSGVVVTWTDQHSSIHQTLPIGDVVTEINSCPIRASADWFKCLAQHDNEGYCNTEKYVKLQNTSLANIVVNSGEAECCNDTTSYRFCFSYQVIKYKSLVKNFRNTNFNKFVRTSNEFTTKFVEHACLPARHTIQYKLACQRNVDCITNDQQMLCLKPLTSNITKVIQIKRNKGQNILFVGDPNELIASVFVSSYLPKYLFSLVNMPQHLDCLFMYLISISSALAILNMVPCFFLDGHQTLLVLLEIVFPTSHKLRSVVATIVLLMGSSLLLINILIASNSLLQM